MGTRFGDLDRYYDPGLILTVKGRDYLIPLASAEVGLWCRRLVPATTRLHQASTDEQARRAVEEIEALPVPPGLDGLTLPELLLGNAYRQMTADGVEDAYIQYCGVTALMYVLGGEDLARRWWESGGRPEAVGPGNRAERRARRKGGSSPTTNTEEGIMTPSRDSGTGMNSRRNGHRGSKSTGRRS